MKFDLKKPGFAVYVNVRGLSKTRADEEIAKMVSLYTTEDVNIMFFPIVDNDTRIECFYNPITI